MVPGDKGDSECDLRVGSGASDEACGFEKLPYDNFGDRDRAHDPTFRPSEKMFVRWALGEGLRLSQTLGANPFQFGLIAATDTHISAPGHVGERSHGAHGGGGKQEASSTEFPDEFEFNPGGLSVVWAEENARRDLRRHAAAGGLRHERPAHRAALLRRLGLRHEPVRKPEPRRHRAGSRCSCILLAC